MKAWGFRVTVAVTFIVLRKKLSLLMREGESNIINALGDISLAQCRCREILRDKLINAFNVLLINADRWSSMTRQIRFQTNSASSSKFRGIWLGPMTQLMN